MYAESYQRLVQTSVVDELIQRLRSNRALTEEQEETIRQHVDSERPLQLRKVLFRNGKQALQVEQEFFEGNRENYRLLDHKPTVSVLLVFHFHPLISSVIVDDLKTCKDPLSKFQNLKSHELFVNQVNNVS